MAAEEVEQKSEGEQTPAETSADGVDLTEKQDGGVRKLVLREGFGDASPQKGDAVLVHYVGTLAEGGDQFDSSRDRDEEFQFNIGKGQVIKAWDLGVASMRKGELAVLTCAPEYAYGKTGSPPKIQPDATLKFEVELLRWEGEDISPDKDKSITRSTQQGGDKYENPNDEGSVKVYLKGFYGDRKFLEGEYSFVVGECSLQGLPEGLEKALKRFRKAERSMIHLHPKWGYGAVGCPQFGIPPNAELDFDILLVDFEKAKDSWQLNDEEKLAEAENIKARGTEFFQQGHHKLALNKYKRIVDFVQYLDNLEGESKAKRDAIYTAARLNLALCYLKIGESHEAINHCDKVLEMDSKNIKALYRRAQAYMNQKDWDLALEDLETVLGLEPENKACQQQMANCKTRIGEQKQKDRQIYGNMFEKFAAQDKKREELAKKQKALEEEEKRKEVFQQPKQTEEMETPAENGVAA